MALIKCRECGGDVSDKASLCPHCGCPIVIEKTQPQNTPVSSSQSASPSRKEISSLKRVVRALVIILCAFGMLMLIFLFVFQMPPKEFIQNIQNIIDSSTQRQLQPREVPPSQQNVEQVKTDLLVVQINSDGSKTYPVQYNNLWGHEFYTSKIDQSGNIDTGSAPKQTIAKLLNSLGYPQRLTKNLVFVNADQTIIKPGDQLEIPWATGFFVHRLDLQPQVGTYQNVYGGAVIALNNLSGYDQATLTHELGHIIGAQLTDGEWQQYYKLRNIPSATPRDSSDWSLSPFEDFAEVYRSTYGQGGPIQTHYGLLIPTTGLSDFEASCLPNFILGKTGVAADADPTVQACRKDNNKASKFGGMLYTYQVGPATQQFVKNVVARLTNSL